jgi:predicted DNA-binding transcriptional regulator AlpA
MSYNKLSSSLLNAEQASDYTGFSVSWLAKLRCRGGGPRYAKIGTKIRYPRDELDRWIALHVRVSTSSELTCSGDNAAS